MKEKVFTLTVLHLLSMKFYFFKNVCELCKYRVNFPRYFSFKIFSRFWIFRLYLDALKPIGSIKISKIECYISMKFQ